MIAEVPQPFVDLGTWAGIFTALSIATALLWKTAPVRWLREKISQSLGEWLKAKITEAASVLIKPLGEAQSEIKQDIVEIKKVVHHHLGHNGDSPKLHDRVQQIESVLQVQEKRHEDGKEH